MLESPHFTDILPIKLATSLVHHQFLIPYFKTLLGELLERRRQPASVEPDLSCDESEQSPRVRQPAVKMNDIVPQMATNRNAPTVSYLSTSTSSSTAATPNSDESIESRKSSRPWSDDEKQLLCKTIIRYPPGTPRRWEKIADVIGRHVSQVTDMAKQIQNTVGSTTNAFQDHQQSFSAPVTIDQNIITERHPSAETISSDWSQSDQHLLECAMKNVPKDTAAGADRWELIARCIPGKTRDECFARYRYIAQLVRAKKIS